MANDIPMVAAFVGKNRLDRSPSISAQFCTTLLAAIPNAIDGPATKKGRIAIPNIDDAHPETHSIEPELSNICPSRSPFNRASAGATAFNDFFMRYDAHM